MRKIVLTTMSLVLGLLLSCSDEVHMLFPAGPQGSAGLSAYEVWVEAVNNGEVNWPKDRTDINNYFLFLKGEDGENGKSAYEIWKEEVAKGLDNPKKPGTEWPKDQISLNDFWYYLTGADGKNGATPYPAPDGYWWINGEPTEFTWKGKNGVDGLSWFIQEGTNAEGERVNTWWSKNADGVETDSHIPVTGPQGPAGPEGPGNGCTCAADNKQCNCDGTGDCKCGDKKGCACTEPQNGKNGLSAYEVWKDWLSKLTESYTDIRGNEWTSESDNRIESFWLFLTGKDGENGEDGEIIIQTISGKYNLKAVPDANGDYVNWNNGNVTYQLVDGSGNPVSGATVGEMPYLIDSANDETFTTDEEGKFVVPVTMLRSDLVNVASRVSKPGLIRLAPEVDESTGRLLAADEIAQTTYVPCKPEIKVVFTKLDLNSWTETYDKERRDCNMMNICTRFKLLRKMDSQSEFEDIPSTMSAKVNVTKESYDHSFQLITQSVPDLNGRTYTISSTVYPKEIQGGAAIEINFSRKICNSEHFQYEGTDTYIRLKEYSRKWYRNDPNEVCYVRYAVRPQNSNSGLYGLEASSDTYFQDVPYLPSPSFIKLEVNYVTDASGSSYIPVKAYYCKGCLENHRYLNSVEYETAEQTINGRLCEVRTVKQKDNYETLNCFSLFCTKIVGTNHQHDVCTKPQSWKTLDEGGYIEFNVIPGGTIGTFIPVVGQPTYWGFEVCDLEVNTETGKVRGIKKRESIKCKIVVVNKGDDKEEEVL